MPSFACFNAFFEENWEHHFFTFCTALFERCDVLRGCFKRWEAFKPEVSFAASQSITQITAQHSLASGGASAAASAAEATLVAWRGVQEGRQGEGKQVAITCDQAHGLLWEV